MSYYTVLLDRPACVSEGDDNDRQALLVEAETMEEAVLKAQKDFLRLDSKEGEGEVVSADFSWLQPKHYLMIAVFDGWQLPLALGYGEE